MFMDGLLEQTMHQLCHIETVEEPIGRLIGDLYSRRENTSEPAWRNWSGSELGICEDLPRAGTFTQLAGSLAYSRFAWMRTGMSGSASFQIAKKSS